MGRSQPLTRLPNGPGSETSSGIFRAYPDISGHSRIRIDHRVPYRSSPDRVPSRPSPDRVPSRPSPDRVRSGPSRAVWPVAGSRPVELIACDMTRRRIVSIGRVACRMTRRRIACGITRRSFTSRPIPAPLGDRMSLRCSRSGAPKVRRQPCPGPTAPVADAANLCLRTYILLHCRGAASLPVRRRG